MTWEQRFFLELGREQGATKLKQHRKREKMSQIIERIIDTWELGDAAFVVGHPHSYCSRHEVVSHEHELFTLVVVVEASQ